MTLNQESADEDLLKDKPRSDDPEDFLTTEPHDSVSSEVSVTDGELMKGKTHPSGATHMLTGQLGVLVVSTARIRVKLPCNFVCAAASSFNFLYCAKQAQFTSRCSNWTQMKAYHCWRRDRDRRLLRTSQVRYASLSHVGVRSSRYHNHGCQGFVPVVFHCSTPIGLLHTLRIARVGSMDRAYCVLQKQAVSSRKLAVKVWLERDHTLPPLLLILASLACLASPCRRPSTRLA